jgi:hypothetical protein
MSVPIADFGVNGKFPSTVGGTGVTVKYFPRNVAYAAGATWVTSPAAGVKSMLAVPGDGKLNGQQFLVKASGDFLQAATESSSEVTVALYAVTGTLAVPVYTQLGTTAAYANASDAVAYPWSLEIVLFGTTGSGIVGGKYTPYVAGVLGTVATTTNVLTGIDFNAGNANLNFAPFGLVVGVTFGQSFAANAANLYQFVIEA